MSLLSGRSAAKTPGLPYLNDLNDPRHQASGAVLAVGDNPASALDAHRGAFRFFTIRAPETRVELLAPNPTGGSDAATRLIREGYTLGLARRGFSLGDSARTTFEAAFRGSGRFTRVNADGRSIHAQPDNDWLVGLSLAKRFNGRLSAGVGAKWLRSKTVGNDGAPDYAHGVSWDLGFQYRPSQAWRIGASARNLSAGVSFPDPTRTSDLRHEIAVGAGRLLKLTDRFALDIAADARFPSKRGAQGSGGATLLYKDDIGLSVGYLRRIERWRAVQKNLSTDETAFDERLWVQEGATFGGWVALGEWEIGGAASPVYLPDVSDDAKRVVLTSRWQWSFGVGRRR